jgi:hypothetical protein
MAAPFAPFPVMTPVNGIVEVSLEFTVGAVGAVGTVAGGAELGTPVRNGAGDYSFPLLQPWIRLLEAHCDTVGPHSTTAGKYAEIIADSVTSTSAPLVRFQFTRGDTGAAAEVAQNDVIKLRLVLQSKS